MHYAALATDYDGTLARDGIVDAPTIAALERLRAASRRIVLVTGRELDDLQRVMPRLDLFDRVVAENGAVVYRPATKETRPLAPPPPPQFVTRLRELGVAPLSVGRAIVATWEPNETHVLQAIRELGLELHIIFNKGAVMVLPGDVTKASGLRAALDELGLAPLNCVGIGDAENDMSFLALCGATVAVANALPALAERAALVTRGARGAGVAELIDAMLHDDLAELDARASAQRVTLAAGPDGAEDLTFVPHRETLLLFGASGGGKSTLTTGLLERLSAGGCQWCVIDPEGDYEGTEEAVGIGTADTPPAIERVTELLRRPGNNVIVNLLGLGLADRPAFFAALLPELLSLKNRLGRPHMVLVDEAHHLLPEPFDPGGALLPDDLAGFLFVTVHPDRLARRTLETVDRILVVGADPADPLAAFSKARGLPPPPAGLRLEPGELLTRAVDEETLRRMRVIPARAARQRHRRKYAEGRLGEDASFYFRGPDGSLNLRAHNLHLFTQIGEGVDEATWQHHRAQGDYSRWIATAIKDEALAEEVAAIERGEADPAAARAAMKQAIERRYTLPA
jgi:hydroxymethylpyrimidine pyrophosphatase-like HAD family hydrolase